MNFLPLRVQRIFDGMFSPDNSVQPQNPVLSGLQGSFPTNAAPVGMQSDPNDFLSTLAPTHDAADKLNAMLSDQPKHEKFQPGFWRKLGSGLISVNDPKLAEEFRNRKYNEAMEDWGAKLKPLQELADAESGRNTQNRMIAGTLSRERTAQNTNQSREKIAEDKNATELQKTQMTLDQRDRYISFLREKNAQPNAIFKSDAQGNVYSADKKTGKMIGYVTDESGKQIKDSDLPDREKLQIQQNNALTRIAATGNEARKTAEVRGDIEGENIEKRGNETRKTNAEKPAATGSSRTAKAKIGDEKVFPNGKVGRWDGVGWVDTGKKAK